MDRLFDSSAIGRPKRRVRFTPRGCLRDRQGKSNRTRNYRVWKTKDIDVTLSGDMLTIRGEKKASMRKRTKLLCVGALIWQFSRSIQLPFRCRTQPHKREFDKGVLHIAIPKPEHMDAKYGQDSGEAGLNES